MFKSKGTVLDEGRGSGKLALDLQGLDPDSEILRATRDRSGHVNRLSLMSLMSFMSFNGDDSVNEINGNRDLNATTVSLSNVRHCDNCKARVWSMCHVPCACSVTRASTAAQKVKVLKVDVFKDKE